ncbi:4-hydroxy-tetrahydrodipicolinate reductase [Bartonella sp. DGB2]|uniref:4-hydroxy-tetrahydrodipicolinate reductase n=1 Tax=Bartonella sp. DGB2 TaxID=3388426 RepID=UPI00398F9D48
MRIAIMGANGQMGRALLKAATANGFTISAAVVRTGTALVGEDISLLVGSAQTGVLISDDPLEAILQSDAVIDFTTPALSLTYAAYAAQARIAHIIGTTGFTTAQELEIAAAARHSPIVKSGNMSLGVNLLAGLVRQAAALLGPNEFDIEIYEMHHRRKVDAPSGTALLLGEAAAHGRGTNLTAIKTESAKGIRLSGAIGFSSARGGTVVGDHSVTFAGENERLILSHFAQDRAIFAKGALYAARWAEKQKPGLYTMMDVLNLNDKP